jgi:hypothetical protein
MMNINPSSVMNKIIVALFELFSIKYTANSNFKKKGILMFAAMLIIHEEHIHFDKKIIDNVEIFNTLDDKINKTFELLKKSERDPE